MRASRASAPVGRAVAGRPPDPLLVAGVSKRYGRVTALSRVDLRVRPGAVVAVVGPNGSGKSTLLGVAAGLVRPDAGTALVAGLGAGCVAAARHAAFVPDEPDGFDELTAAELLSLVAALHGTGAEVLRRRGELVECFALQPLLRRMLGELSRGQRRRVALAAALQLDVPLVLVDEATATLDDQAVAALRDRLSECARRGAGVLLASHDAAFVEAVADEVVPLASGRLARRPAPSPRDARALGEPTVV